MSGVAHALVALLDASDPGDWTKGNHTLDHKDGVSIWLLPWPSLYRPQSHSLGFRGRRAVKAAMRRLAARQIDEVTS